MISAAAAGHVTPMFELAKAMKNHNVTFITEPYARNYLNLNKISNKSSIHLIYVNDSTEAINEQKKGEEKALEFLLSHSLFDNIVFLLEKMAPIMNPLMNETIHQLMTQQYDVIIANSFFFGINSLCVDIKIPCVIHFADSLPNIFDVNIPVGYALLTSEQMNKFSYRIFNIAFTIRLLISMAHRMIKSIYTISQYMPCIPGPYYETFNFKNLWRQNTNSLKLYSIPATLFPPMYSDTNVKHLGAFLDDTSIDSMEDNLEQWIKSKSDSSIIFAAFGSTGIIGPDRMKSLIEGLVIFLLQTPDASILLAFRNSNHKMYNMVLKGMNNDEHLRLFSNNDRVRVENQFIPQKSILKQSSIGLFISHCGMGSLVEGLYFEKPILCLPLHSDQFVNAMGVDYSKVGQSLFVPPSLYETFLNLHDFHDYSFSIDHVTMSLSSMWMNSTYKQAARMMSLDMKHAGGVKRAIEEIEHIVNINGDLDRYTPFQQKLPFYQRYMLDVAFIYLLLPIMLLTCVFRKRNRQSRKQKSD